MDKAMARRVAEQRLQDWHRSTSYAELLGRDLDRSTDDGEVTGPDGVVYRVRCTLWKEQHSDAVTLSVKVDEAHGRRLFARSVSVGGRVRPDGTLEPGF